MDILEIIGGGRDAGNIIADLKQKQIDIPDWGLLLKQYEPTLHEIVNDTTARRDKVRKDGVVEKASRIHIGLERLLVRRFTEFTCAIPVKRIYHNTEDNEVRQQIAKAIEAIYKYARIDSHNKKRLENYFASCEVNTLWYLVESPNTLYGFNSQYKLKCKTFSPMDGVDLYPLFDEMGDMIAMSMEYKTKVGDAEVLNFETFTADHHYRWKLQGAGWDKVVDEKISIGKIPCSYLYRPVPVYHGLSHIREEIEYTLSRNSDVIAYNSAPILKIVGGMQGTEAKGEEKRIYRVENGGDVGYVSWAQAIEALKYHVETLTNLFWTQSQMPDISFSNMRSLGNIGYDARQTLLTDAHLRIGDESGAIIEMLERECNVIKAILKEMNKAWEKEIDNVEIEHVITPFIQNDEKAEIDKWVNACGGKAIVSQLDAIRYFGASTDPERTLEQIQEEEGLRQNQMNDIFEGSI